MKFLITGGFGFVGTHLVERLLSDGHHVTVIDNLSSCPIPHDLFLKEIGHPSNLDYRTISVESYYDVVTRMKSTDKYDGIYHLAAYVGPAGVLHHAGYIAWQTIKDTLLVSELALKWGCRLVNVSTSEVYGGGQKGLCREDMNCIIQPQTSARLEYASGKLSSEIALRNTHNLNHISIRPFNICGVRQSGKNGFVLPRFISQALSGEALTIFGDGTAIRAFTDVRDIADGLVLAMERGKTGQVYNLGNQKGKTTIGDLAKSVLSAIPESKSNIIHTDGKAIYGKLWEDAADKYPDSSKAMDKLGWQPKYSISDIIRDVIEYEREKAKQQ